MPFVHFGSQMLLTLYVLRVGWCWGAPTVVLGGVFPETTQPRDNTVAAGVLSYHSLGIGLLQGCIAPGRV